MSFVPESFASTDISSRPGFIFDVFLSFRGEDTRKNFADPLYSALAQAGIHVFRDNDEIQLGEDISPHLIEAIRRSRISIVIFSRGYAFSRYCLDELVEIVECRHATSDQIVLPIFYDIDPSDVRKQKGSFAEAFERHEERFKENIEKVKRWREALTDAGNLSGWNINDVANGYESKFIKKIVEEVSYKLGPLNKVDKESEVELLNQAESLQLFSWHAFRNTHPAEDFLELATDVLGYCSGHRLSLEVWGRYLFQKSKRDWKRIVEELKKIRSIEILGKPRVNNEVLNKLETTEWTLLITNLLLEGISAIFDQLGYALLGMVMAFAALILCTIDIFRMARKERSTWDGRSLLPCFGRRSAHVTPAGKPFGTVVEYFGLVGAVWQCFYSTLQYAYARQNKDNPIKMCLLPFIFVVCVVISKLIRQKARMES